MSTKQDNPTRNSEGALNKDEILAAHNSYREEVDIPPLTWCDDLASHAKKWAKHLASLGGEDLQHSEDTGEGENLWMGTSGAYTYTQMVDSWGEEKEYFEEGTFPDISSTGDWSDVGHYTQIVWKKTKKVGCAIASAGGNDIFVCRYSPPGNFEGEDVY
jgi:hypothetical protein